MRIELPDGSIKEFPQPVAPGEVASAIGAGLAKAAIGAKVDGQLWDLKRPLTGDAKLAIITRPRTDKDGKTKGEHNPDALYLLRHSCAHVMAEAILRLWPDAQLAYGPPLDNGFYYDIKLDTPISSDDFPRIEDEMRKIVAEDRPFTRYELTAGVGLDKLRAEGNKYKIDNAQRALDGGAEMLSWYVTGDPGVDVSCTTTPVQPRLWEDLCMGPHVPSTGVIGAFKITSVASSHWHGDINSDRFQRVYGTAFFSQADLDAHLQQLEEARQRDHRVIGQKLGLFVIDELVGQGLILWKPRGAMVRNLLQEFLQAELLKRGYDVVYTPHIGKIDLYRTSGHYPYYEDSQYPQIRQIRDETRPLLIYLREVRDGVKNLDRTTEENMVAQAGMEDKYPYDERNVDTKLAVVRYYAQSGENYLLKPMNCPHHIRIYASDKHSYRDLPVRLAEFGTVYRWEQSGELNGMTRVRGFTQDDAHIFCTQEQIKEEFRSTLQLVQWVFRTFGFDEVTIRLGLRDPTSDKYVGDPALWDQAENTLRELLEEMGVSYIEGVGEAAFYGPKTDFLVRDVIGRRWQLGTVQLDYNLPQRFELEYVGADNQTHRPAMIHRAPFGSMERFMAILIEHYHGSFPLWLAPEQVRVLPISDKFLAYGQQVLEQLKAAGLRATLEDSNDRVNAKIKVAQDLKIPYMLVVGGRDQEANAASVRDRSRGDLGALPVTQLIEQLKAEVASHGKQVVTV